MQVLVPPSWDGVVSFPFFFIYLATWPSGKAGDCKSFSPRFKSGCRLINKRRKIPYSLCSYNFVHNGEMWRERLLILLLDMSLRILFRLCLMFADSTKNSIRTSSNKLIFWIVFNQWYWTESFFWLRDKDSTII